MFYWYYFLYIRYTHITPTYCIQLPTCVHTAIFKCIPVHVGIMVYVRLWKLTPVIKFVFNISYFCMDMKKNIMCCMYRWQRSSLAYLHVIGTMYYNKHVTLLCWPVLLFYKCIHCALTFNECPCFSQSATKDLSRDSHCKMCSHFVSSRA